MVGKRVVFAGKLRWTSELGCFNSFVLAMQCKKCFKTHAVLPSAMSAQFGQQGW